jgi:hypothetical protein
MDQPALNKYLEGMDHGEWGDGIILSAAVRLYCRPIVIVTPDGREQIVDAADDSCVERIRLGLINTNHYVSINNASCPEKGVTVTNSQQQQQSELAYKAETLDENDSDDLSIQSETPDCAADSTAAAVSSENQDADVKLKVCSTPCI